MSLQTARHENEQLLASRLDELRCGKALDLLEPFARAYLGLFYEIDANLAPEKRIELLANEQIATAILDGFVAALTVNELPTTEAIARAQGQSISLGFIMLSGIDRLLRQQGSTHLSSLPAPVLQTLLAFHYTHTSYIRAEWVETLLADADISVPVMNEIWRVYLERGEHVLPAYLRIFRSQDLHEVKQRSVIPLLRRWKECQKKYLRELLAIAFQYGDKKQLLEVAREKVAAAEELDEYRYTLWFASAFLLEPDEFAPGLAVHVGRVKQKVLPLLDFVTQILAADMQNGVEPGSMGIAQLLRIIAPIFVPQSQTGHDNTGLDVNSQNVVKLMYRLAADSSRTGQSALKWLKKARVMKIYSQSIAYMEKLQKAGSDPAFQMPDFDSFVQTLLETHALHGRSNRFDLN